MLDYSDLTYYKEGGNIFAGGYKVTDIVKYQGHQPYDINTESLLLDNQMGGGEGTGTGTEDKSMSNLGVPSGLFYLAQRVQQTQVPFASHEMIPDDLYDNLLRLVKMDTSTNAKTKAKSKKTSINKNNKKKSKKRD